MRQFKKHLRPLLLTLVVMTILCVPAFAASGGKGNVGAVVDMILAIAFFGKTGLAYFDYKKHGQFEWTGPVILFACLILTLIAPNYIWTIIGI